jgi:fluoroquinolone resistance protein
VSDVIESATQLLMLAEERELAGKTMRNVVAPGCGLSGADLDSVTFERVSLERANLSNSRLEHASLRSVDLTGVDFEGSLFHRVRAYDNTIMTEARLVGCEIRRCELGPNLRMPKADFTRAKVQGTTFRQVELYGANFKNAIFLRSSFVDYANSTASLTRARFVEAVLIDVDLREVNLYGADFSRALLIRCDLRAAKLDEAVMTGTRLIDCRTEGADLRSAKV